MQAVFTLLVVLGCAISVQAQDVRVDYLAEKILEKVPDAPYARDALGTTEERETRAREHAAAIVMVADELIDEWVVLAKDAGWTEFQPLDDLPALIAAIAFHESSFRSVARLDDETIVKVAPRKGRADMGVLQVRAPSKPAEACGVQGRKDTQKLVDDLAFAYRVGACILTQRIAAYVPLYRTRAFLRPHRAQRLPSEYLFYAKNRLARELVVVERYNWGGSNLYLHPVHGSYARRIVQLFTFFREKDPTTLAVNP